VANNSGFLPITSVKSLPALPLGIILGICGSEQRGIVAAEYKRASLRLIPGTKEDLLHAFLEHVPDGIYFKDRESRFVRISRSLANRFGLSDPSLATNKTDFDMFSREHAEQALADEQQIIRTGQPVFEKEEKETWPDGRENWVLTTKLPLMDEEGNIIGTMGISHDITERKRTAEELDHHRVHLEKLVTERTAELARANKLLERDIAIRKVVEQELTLKAQQLVKVNAELESLSLTDDLTGLYNRRGFRALADHRIRLASRTGDAFSIVFVDLYGLKQINDRFGHQAGNLVLIEAADVLRAAFRSSDIVARLGGDEFAVFIAETGEDEIARRMQQRFDHRNSVTNHPYQLSFSAGIVSWQPGEDTNVDRLLGRADSLMYQQKQKKRSSRSLADTNI